MQNTIFRQPISIDPLQRAQRLQQTPMVVWFTGLSGSGKSTLANAVDHALWERGYATYLLDGDNVRHGLCKDLGFSVADRAENIRRVGEVARLMVDAGLIVLASFISPSHQERDAVRARFEHGRFIEVHVATPLEVCEQRDPKGLYRLARAGSLPEFTGISAPYDPPTMPEIIIDTSKQSLPDSVALLLTHLLAQQPPR
uniref:Adenylyl-sulfate kinase n=1 Tax=uncultured bacterium A1Q1_fos_500 TaxID=1256579 RepID=L7VX95_9BACT|nr:adenylylsulfate kinase [uncultured bacterium A1Q1_fos_500]